MSKRATPGVPSVGNDPRDSITESREPEEKTWFRDLDEAVIEADRCVQCGSCMAACPSDSIGIEPETGRPTLVRMCTGCSRCWDFCPRSGLRYERLNELEGESPDAAYAASADDDHEGQDGGAVTALLAGLLAAGEIDGAVVVSDGDDPLAGEATLATSPEELFESAGSTYSQTMQLGQVDDLVAESDLVDPDIALVGTPCVIQGAAALDRLQYDDELASVSLTVSLVCTRSFAADRLRSLLVGNGVDMDDVDSLEVVGGALTARDADGHRLLTKDVEAFDAAALRGCAECADAVGKAADISAGNVGSPDGKTTLLARTDDGTAAIEAAMEALDIDELDSTDALDAFADWNRRQAEATIPRERDSEASLTVTYTEHREAYDGTGREPEPLNPARVHQYEEWC
ncbi:homolog to coenzyme F420 hydrogenase [Natronomonas pharaonis DSM 2160]|uniref:Homolog to coenzyme F420 hydrogenase n=1 Tax=Natronomonas pharaonis (strain ATCC 35678 / DSM 2160 / CIP 103997 / JCM 8858 / NBRC 14720 / NCIMB 2260 / Gabara) TaxID=348780 RepID=A0A1U7EY07_NATPD|nr:Coenzyme F420 hydrogenase/dehydrogenase, beta subunit C-terminal domain [Natronomonas pharaonis]CAI50094.1 homolog to coenzyme F420 hydrogenase [Natronomonas pharaonis DSM 2160]